MTIELIPLRGIFIRQLLYLSSVLLYYSNIKGFCLIVIQPKRVICFRKTSRIMMLVMTRETNQSNVVDLMTYLNCG
jgi:hypothetical protein